ncbi:MAG: NADH-quinone oxidoreductase subunit N [Proteobacteria bacterium]|nr:NADH-quinone oxidoreductase subunit N [Pseudomonadota bacterium]MBU1742042.1 NADH-quinone oxidoreductase subunit N [Pseudomonadota bacterium]
MDVLRFLPEVTLSAMAVVMLGLSLFNARARVAQLSALFASSVCLAVTLISLPAQGTLFFGAYQVDLFSQIFKVVLVLGLFLVVCLSSDLGGVDEKYHGEYYFFLTTCTLGMVLLVSAVELLTLYIALELSSYSLYILVPLRRDTGRGTEVEAAVKYLFFGAAASAVMLFGMSYLFGLTHTTYLADIFRQMPTLLRNPATLVALLFTGAGLMFKLSLFPFHFWAPDVYQGSANQVATFVATVSKAAAVAVIVRIFALAGGDGANVGLVQALTFLSIASMTVGNLAAIVQKDFKRMLAYSSIAHAGYILIGVVAMTPSGFAASAFYAAGYLVMNFACFYVLTRIATDGGDLPITGLSGLYSRSPLYALTLLTGLISLAGIPPTVGFVAKWYVFAAAMKQGHWFLVLVGAVNAVISLYYYLRVLRMAYLAEPGELPVVRATWPNRVLNVALMAALVYAGFFPGSLTDMFYRAARTLFG